MLARGLPVADGVGDDVESGLDGAGAADEFLDDEFLRLPVAGGSELRAEKDVCQLVSDRVDGLFCVAHFRVRYSAEAVPHGGGENPRGREGNYEL
jgi:hypothetical protein